MREIDNEVLLFDNTRTLAHILTLPAITTFWKCDICKCEYIERCGYYVNQGLVPREEWIESGK